jgi:hypothetical protein
MNFLKWFSQPIVKVGFEDIKYGHSHKDYIIINTMDTLSQDCLIMGTIPYLKEEKVINNILENYRQNEIKIIIYGRNSVDTSCETKYLQLQKLGFSEIYIYSGGLFEWLLLQDIYGCSEFPTTSKQVDILKYRASKTLTHNLLLK